MSGERNWTPGPWPIQWGDPINVNDIAYVPISSDGKHTAHARLIAESSRLANLASSLVDRDCVINGNKIVIEFNDHREAFNALFYLRMSIAKARGERCVRNHLIVLPEGDDGDLTPDNNGATRATG